MPYSKGFKVVSQAFARMPIFDMDGKKLVGQGANSADLAPETAESHGQSHPKAGLVSMKNQTKSVPAPKDEAKPKEELIPVGF